MTQTNKTTKMQIVAIMVYCWVDMTNQNTDVINKRLA